MPHVTLQGERLRVVVDSSSGALREVVHRQAGLALIGDPETAARHPFMVIMADGSIRRAWTGCTVQAVETHTVLLRWTLHDALVLSARLVLDPHTGEVQVSVALANPAGLPVAAVAYPYIAGIGPLGDLPDQDELTHPYATGFLVHDPLHTLPPVASETEGQQPIVLGLYPEGFSGSTMQFMAYSAVGRGGFYLATEDGEGHEKWLNAYLHPDGDLRMAIWHGPADYAARRAIEPAYRTVLAALDGGTWYDAADRYKSWALGQPWTAQGPLRLRDDRCRWLLEQVGYCTFGINARFDRSAWLAEVHRIAGVPGLHVSGPNWPNAAADYQNHLPAGLAEWFPARFHPNNVAMIRRNGEYLVPFEFNLLFGQHDEGSDAAAGKQALQVVPHPTLSRDAYAFPFLCPASPLTRHLHIERDRRLVKDVRVDGVYYDISVNNVRHLCLSDAHGHPPGDSAAVTDAFRRLLSSTAEAMRTAAGGEVIPQGTEMINEQMLPLVAFYQARAEAAPAAPFEATPFHDLLVSGAAVKIPLFAYVYHEYGPLRMDGWAKLSAEQGQYVYFVLGRVFVQGGLLELNYEFSALEEVNGAADTAAEHYWAFAERRYVVDPHLAAYVGRLARARVGHANRYLSYGTMLRPALLTVEGSPRLQLDYFSYNTGQDWDGYEARGTMEVSAVLQGAWRYGEDSAAWLLLNLTPDERVVQLHLAPDQIGIPAVTAWTLALHQDGAPPAPLGPLRAPRTVALILPSRCPVMIEATPDLSG